MTKLCLFLTLLILTVTKFWDMAYLTVSGAFSLFGSDAIPLPLYVKYSVTTFEPLVLVTFVWAAGSLAKNVGRATRLIQNHV